jgi:hypothetical protein
MSIGFKINSNIIFQSFLMQVFHTSWYTRHRNFLFVWRYMMYINTTGGNKKYRCTVTVITFLVSTRVLGRMQQDWILFIMLVNSYMTHNPGHKLNCHWHENPESHSSS